VRSWITRVNPLVLIAVGMCALVGSFWVRSVPAGVGALAAYVLVAALILPGWRYAAMCAAFTAFAALTITYSTWRLGGRDLEVAVTAGMRIFVMAWPGSVAVGYLDHTRLADYLAQNLRVPPRLAAAFSVALQRFTGLTLAWGQLERARRVRGFGPGASPVARVRHAGNMSFALLVQAMRGTTATSVAMDARGFADPAAQRRTWAEPATWTTLDRAFLTGAALLGAVPIVIRVWEIWSS
jgi:energy-coupling factor transport system permease protein